MCVCVCVCVCVCARARARARVCIISAWASLSASVVMFMDIYVDGSICLWIHVSMIYISMDVYVYFISSIPSNQPTCHNGLLWTFLRLCLCAPNTRTHRSLRGTIPEWKSLVPEFTYHGSNCYAFLLAKYGQTSVGAGGGGDGGGGGGGGGELVQCKLIDTFDLVVYQLYESYSHSNYHEQVNKGSLAAWVTNLVLRMEQGWLVRFSSDQELGFQDHVVKVPREKLLIGLANAWAHGSERDSAVRGVRKTLFVRPRKLQPAVAQLQGQEGQRGLRGFAFWSLVHGVSAAFVPLPCYSVLV